jgi:hypothetical protein
MGGIDANNKKLIAVFLLHGNQEFGDNLVAVRAGWRIKEDGLNNRSVGRLSRNKLWG